MIAPPLTVLTQYRDRQVPPLSQTELARQIGVSRATVSRWEAGERRPDRKYLPLIARLTGAPIAELIGYVEDGA